HPVECGQGGAPNGDLSGGLPEGLLPFGPEEHVWVARLAVGSAGSPLVFWLPDDVAHDLKERLERAAELGGGLAPPRERPPRPLEGPVRAEPARFPPLRQPTGGAGERGRSRVLDLPAAVPVEVGPTQ